MTDRKEARITIHDKEYAVADLTEAGRAHIAHIQFVDEHIQQKQNEWAIADTARMAYSAAMKRDAQK